MKGKAHYGVSASNFRNQILNQLDHHPDPFEEILIQSAEKYLALQRTAYARIGDMESTINLGAANTFTKSTTELMKILKTLGVLNGSGTKSKKNLQAFFNSKNKVIRK